MLLASHRQAHHHTRLPPPAANAIQPETAIHTPDSERIPRFVRRDVICPRSFLLWYRLGDELEFYAHGPFAPPARYLWLNGHLIAATLWLSISLSISLSRSRPRRTRRPQRASVTFLAALRSAFRVPLCSFADAPTSIAAARSMMTRASSYHCHLVS
ncbi:hypothetical protein C8R45DRAFT_162321 [Mycena sanguinolenta]|nr:hypothetical protein C8R45DRAFT_162321 [Mycena sanguinolenta]